MRWHVSGGLSEYVCRAAQGRQCSSGVVNPEPIMQYSKFRVPLHQSSQPKLAKETFVYNAQHPPLCSE